MRDQPQTREAGGSSPTGGGSRPSKAQLAYLRRGLDQPGGKLPLFDAYGQRINERTVQSCIEQGWATPWFNNPLKPDWLVCKLTPSGRIAAERG
ncbi:MAG: hypothetical protein RIB45_13205 [Marivibrio sp.]|uniref:hypothetical protein n=1 Tax=Marivibrio sp. TaxID=2039719 RepID=UPI0032ECF16A